MNAHSRYSRLFCRLAVAMSLGAASLALSGCARSELIGFERHLSTTVRPGPAENKDVIAAFRLDEPAVPPSAVARGQ